MQHVGDRPTTRVQLTTDGHKACLEAVEGAFGNAIHYAMPVQANAEPVGALGHYNPGECGGTEQHREEGRPDKAHVSALYVERQTLNPRMGMHRLTRLTNAFSKDVESHYWMVFRSIAFDDYVRDRKAFRCTIAMVSSMDN
jgi:hypothetical protein